MPTSTAGPRHPAGRPDPVLPPGRRTAGGDRRRRHLVPRAPGRVHRGVPAGPVQHADRLRRGRGGHLGEQLAPGGRAAAAHRARRRAGHAALCAGARPATSSAYGALRDTGAWTRPTSAPATWWSWPAASGWPRCAAPSTSWSHRPDAEGGRSVRARRCPRARPAHLRRRLEAWERAGAVVQSPWTAATELDRPRRAWSPRCWTSGFDPATTTALVCGPEIMMRFTARALIDRGVDPDRIRVSLERNMQCGIGCAATASSARSCSAATGPSSPTPGVVAGCSASASDDHPHAATPPTHAGRVEVRLLRRLPAQPARLRGRAPRRWPATFEIAHFTEMSGPTVAGPYDLSLVEGSITTAGGRRAHPGGPGQSGRWSPSAPAPPPAASRACATSPPRGLRRDRLRAPRVHRHPRHLDPDLGPRRRWTSSCTAARSTGASCSRCSPPSWPADARPSPATACARSARRGARCACSSPAARPASGPVTRAGCGALCPRVGRGCFGCFGPAETANTASLAAQLRRQGLAPVDASRLFAHLQRRRPGLPRGVGAQGGPVPVRWRIRRAGGGTDEPWLTGSGARSASRAWPGSRARARCGSRCTTAR